MAYPAAGVGALHGRISFAAVLIGNCRVLKEMFLNGDGGHGRADAQHRRMPILVAPASVRSPAPRAAALC